MPDLFEWLKLIASISTPIIVLVLGVRLNRQLEESRSNISKARDWEGYWAAAFLKVAQSYNDCVTRIVVSMVRDKRANLEEIRVMRFEFIDAVRLTHEKLL